jgi:peptidoglycan hydrolase-like protein with peptidoglycan-binding domain
MCMRKNVIRLLLTTTLLFVSTEVYAGSCTVLTKTLSKGSENSEVLTLQQFLFDSGYLIVKPNGYFGQNTKVAVMAFQKKYNINQTGSVGQLTRAKIKEISCSSSTTPIVKQTPSVDVVVIKEAPAEVPVKEMPTIYIKTLIPSSVTSSEATLSGNGGIDGEKHWFEWGNTMDMKNVTPQTVSATSYTYKITGLAPSTTYYFRAITSVATTTDRKGETAYGEMRYFTTPAATVAASPLPTVSISSTGIAVNTSGSAKVTWTSTNASTCYFTQGEVGGEWTNQRSLSGEYITRPMTQAATFGIYCKNNSGYTVAGSVAVPKIVN